MKLVRVMMVQGKRVHQLGLDCVKGYEIVTPCTGDIRQGVANLELAVSNHLKVAIRDYGPVSTGKLWLSCPERIR